MDQDDVGLLRRQRFEAGMHRGLTRRAAICGRLVAQSRNSLVEDRGVIGVHHRLHGKHVRMSAERLHGAEDHGLSADLAILLGSPGTGAKPAPGCDEDGCCALRSGHLKLKYSESGLCRGGGLPQAHSPYHAEYGKTERFPLAVGKAVFVAVHLHK